MIPVTETELELMFMLMDLRDIKKEIEANKVYKDYQKLLKEKYDTLKAKYLQEVNQ